MLHSLNPMRVVATLLLLAHLGVLAAPVLAEAGPPVLSKGSHCGAHAVHVWNGAHAGPSITPPSEKCSNCDMPACPGMVSCAGVGVAIVTLSSLDLAPAALVVADGGPSDHLTNLFSAPLSPPPKP